MQQIIILKKKMRRLFIRYINGSHIILLRSASSNTPGNGGDFDFMAAGPWYDPVLTAHFPGWGVVTNDLCAYFFRLYALVICDHAPAQRNVKDSDFMFAVPHSNHQTVGTASWQNHDSSPPQSVIILHCHVCLGLSNPYISSALWRQ